MTWIKSLHVDENDREKYHEMLDLNLLFALIRGWCLNMCTYVHCINMITYQWKKALHEHVRKSNPLNAPRYFRITSEFWTNSLA